MPMQPAIREKKMGGGGESNTHTQTHTYTQHNTLFEAKAGSVIFLLLTLFIYLKTNFSV